MKCLREGEKGYIITGVDEGAEAMEGTFLGQMGEE